MGLPGNHPDLYEGPERTPDPAIEVCPIPRTLYSHTCNKNSENSQTLLAPPTAIVIATIAFASSPSVTQEVIVFPPHGRAEDITRRLRNLLHAKTFDKYVNVSPIKGNKYPCFLALTPPHLRNTGTLLSRASLGNFVRYSIKTFPTWDVSYDAASGQGRVSIWWVRSRKEERKLLKEYITEIYAPARIREIERNRAERKLLWCF